MNFSIEDLDRVLKHKNILLMPHGDNSSIEFRRRRDLIINGTMYIISWYINQCYLTRDRLTVPFSFVKQSNTWPNRAKTNLQFYNKKGDICCILMLEEL
jgi:hypothetical protein